MVQAGLVERGLPGLTDGVVFVVREPGRRRWWLLDEAAPAVQVGQVPLGLLGLGCRHGRFQGSSSGSNKPSGITSASVSSDSSGVSSQEVPELAEAGVTGLAAFVRAATRRSRLLDWGPVSVCGPV